jgi:hypothetical protein
MKFARLDLGDEKVNRLNVKASHESIRTATMRGLRTSTHPLKKLYSSQPKSAQNRPEKC